MWDCVSTGIFSVSHFSGQERLFLYIFLNFPLMPLWQCDLMAVSKWILLMKIIHFLVRVAGVWKMLTIADRGGKGGEANDYKH